MYRSPQHILACKQDGRNSTGQLAAHMRNNENRHPESNLQTMAKICPILVMLTFSGCVNLPTIPSVMALPGTSLSFEQFRDDDADCRQYAYIQIGGTTATQAATESGAASAAIGTAVGAAAGAAIAGGGGAAIGAGTGLAVGSIVGSTTAEQSIYATQHYYDMAYIQCMYAKGHRVPVSGEFRDNFGQPPITRAVNIPPPPPGSPPPPPTR